MGCYALLQGIFPTWESNSHLLHLQHCRQILYPLSHLGSPCAKHTRTLVYVVLFNPYKSPAAAAAAESLQLCPTLCDPIDGSPPGSPVPGILQARTLEWVAISFSNA